MLALPDPPLGDGHVVLRAFGLDDVEALVASSNDPLVQLYTRVPTPYTADDARDFVTGAPARRLFDEALDLAVASPGDDRLLGAIGLIVDRHDDERAEIGYWVNPGDRGHGIAGRALALLSRWALEEARFVRLDLQAAVTNRASLRVAERCGFVREGTLRAAWYRGPERTDMAVYSLLRDDAGRFPA
jgi:RimJ/RimL family protein N-acetyltransferase